MLRKLAALSPFFSSLIFAAPRLVLSTASINAGQVTTGSNGATQTVDAQNAGTGTLNLKATASAMWLSATVGALGPCTVLTGSCYPVSIALATASLAAGTYTEFLTLTDPNAVDSPQQVAVSVTIASVPDSITLYAAPAGSGVSSAVSYIYPASTVSGAVSTNSGGNWLQFVPKGGFIIAPPNTAQAVALNRMPPGTYTGTMTISGLSKASDNKTIQVTFVVGNQPIVDPATLSTFQLQGVQGGGRTSSYFAFTTLAPSTFPTAGSPLYFVSPGQINFQLPYSLSPGSVATVQVVNGSVPGSVRSMTITANAPRALVFSSGYAIALNTDSSFPMPSTMSIPGYATHPAKPGDYLVIYAIGFGQTSPGAIEGQAATASPLENAPATTITFGSQFGGLATATAAFSGLTPTAVRLYQINVQVPQDVPLSGSLPVSVTMGGAQSNTFLIAVSADGSKHLCR